MKIVLKHMLAATALAACAFGFVSPQAAQAATPTVIVVVNLDAVVGQSKVGQSLNTQAQTYVKSLQTENKKVEDGLAAEAKSLSGQRQLLPQADFQKKAQSLQQREMDHQRLMQQKQQELQLGLEKAKSQIMDVLRPIFDDIMKRNGANILMDQSALVLSSPELDISPEVLRRLNEKMTAITLKPIPLSSLQQAAPAKTPAKKTN